MKSLVLDDEAVSRKVLAKVLSSLGECITADSGRKAIAEFDAATAEKKPFDLLILDISMPDIDGIQVLATIRAKEKKTGISKADRVKIIMVTATMRKSSIKKCIQLGCNGYISKPYNRQLLFKDLERLGFTIPEAAKPPQEDVKTYARLVGEIIKRFNKGEIEMPVLPHMVQEVRDLLEKSDPSMEDLAKIVAKDAVISSKLISLANSALYKGLDSATTLNAALQRLGLKETLSLITTLANKNLYVSEQAELNRLLHSLFIHSLACACCARFIASELGEKEVEGFFLTGIIHDIGKVLLLKAVSDISPNESFADQALHSAIQEVHTVFGAVLIKKWGFSKPYVQAVEFHHWSHFPEGTQKELLVLHIADVLVKSLGYSFSGSQSRPRSDEVPPELTDILRRLNLDTGVLKEIGEKTVSAMNDLSGRV